MSLFNKPLVVKNLKLKNRVFLAPLAGVSDIPFRRICQEMGAGLTYVEMLSATAIAYQNKKTFQMMARHADEHVLGVQVTGPDAKQVAAAVAVLDAQGFDSIDINMGCPVKKVVNAGCGSAILKDPFLVSEMVALSRASTQKAFSAKFRLGYTRDNINVQETVRRVVEGGVDFFTIHGRTRSESYSTPCDHVGIAEGFSAVSKTSSVVKVGNGDLFSWKDALDMYNATQCDAVMISRGALGNPWIFSEILEEKVLQPTLQEWFELVMRHVQYQEQHYGDTKLSAILLRKHLLWYTKGFPKSKMVRDSLNMVDSLSSARSILTNYVASLPSGLIRYEGLIQETSSDYDPKFEMNRELDRGVFEG